MEKADERRAEQRLYYRWPVRFAAKAGEKSLSGQMFDVSSEGMAFLFHANKSCPRPDQSITANFGVPHFDSQGSFDTAFFNRVGRVCRVDNLNSRVNRIAVQFAEPLFFKPGEQGISKSDAQQRLQAKARIVVDVREKDKASAEAEAERRTKTEGEAWRKAKLYEEQMAVVKSEAAREIARIEAETAYKVAEAKAEVRAKLHEQSKAREEDKKSEQKSGKESVVKKLDGFIKDRNKVY